VTDHRHLTPQNVEELWQLIEIAPAQNAPNLGHPRIALARLGDPVAILLQCDHGAELEDLDTRLSRAVPNLNPA
jgi:hypothetical protein